MNERKNAVEIRVPEISIEDDLADIDEAAEIIDAIKIESHNDLRQAVAMTATVKETAKELDEKRQSWTKPLNDVVSSINETFSPAQTALANAERKLKALINKYLLERYEKHDTLLDQVKDADDETRKVLLARVEDCIPPKVTGLSVRESKTGKVVDHDTLVQWLVTNNRWECVSVIIRSS